jgi:hypothetical protein
MALRVIPFKDRTTSVSSLTTAITQTGVTLALDASYLCANEGVNGRDECAIQIEFTSTGSVDIQAQLESTLSFVTVQTAVIANGIYRIGLAPAYKLSITANGSGVKACLLG